MQLNLKRIGSAALTPITMCRHWLGLAVAGLMLSNRGRRMLLAVSLYAHLKDVDTGDMDTDVIQTIARDINELFKLVKSNEGALLIPILMHNSIWKHVELPDEDELKHAPIRNNCRRILKRVPCWLRYDEKVMSDDIALILRKYVGRRVAY